MDGEILRRIEDSRCARGFAGDFAGYPETKPRTFRLRVKRIEQTNAVGGIYSKSVEVERKRAGSRIIVQTIDDRADDINYSIQRLAYYYLARAYVIEVVIIPDG